MRARSSSVLPLLLFLSAATTSAPALSFSDLWRGRPILQRAPSSAAVFGTGAPADLPVPPAVEVTLSPADGRDVPTRTVRAAVNGTEWKAVLPPVPAGGTYSLRVRCVSDGCGSRTDLIKGITFGDIWFCAGGSNMALNVRYTTEKEASLSAVRGGNYSNIRLFGAATNMNPVHGVFWKDPSTHKMDALLNFGSTCWYFAAALTDRLGDEAPPIGIVHVAEGGSLIKDWVDDETLQTCQYTMEGDGGRLFRERVRPFVDMTVKGWIWYQGENDMGGFFGNSLQHTGYACLMEALVTSWRALWSAVPNTTDPSAPFGVVTLPPSGAGASAGGQRNAGGMRLAQTASRGVLPNSVLPNTFVAQGYDLDDPMEVPESETPFFVGYNTTHPRNKGDVGERLAQLAEVVAYSGSGPVAGPTLAGCRVDDSTLRIQFDPSLLEDSVQVRKHFGFAASSKLEVLAVGGGFCTQSRTDEDGSTVCIDDGSGTGSFGSKRIYPEKYWVQVEAKSTGPHEIAADLTATHGIAHGVRYAWEGACCPQPPCPVASCPLMGFPSNLPANPFLARIQGGRCACVPPQSCDAFLEDDSTGAAPERRTMAPVTPAPADSPVSPAPTDASSISFVAPLPTEAPIAPAPTDAPVTPAPTDSPISPAPTKAPSKSPVTAPISPAPTDAPVTPAPTEAPVSPAPTDAPSKSPVSPLPTETPISPAPTDAPVTPAPTEAPVSPAPTDAPSKSPVAPSPADAADAAVASSPAPPAPDAAPPAALGAASRSAQLGDTPLIGILAGVALVFFSAGVCLARSCRSSERRKGSSVEEHEMVSLRYRDEDDEVSTDEHEIDPYEDEHEEDSLVAVRRYSL